MLSKGIFADEGNQGTGSAMYRVCEICRLPNTNAFSECPQCSSGIAHLPGREGSALEGAVLEKRYRMDQFVGEGAMAWVYRGTHVDLGSSVAVKLLKPAFSGDSRFLARFKKEATAIGALSHPNILSVITSGDTPTGIPYMICEFIRGQSLGDIIKHEGRLPLPRSLNIMNQILSALDEAHSRGVVHRDLKPDNIMVMTLRSGEDFCKIVDFGIAFHQVSNEQRLTQHGEIFGTPEYMSPETIKGNPATSVSDLYAAGIILYEMLTGKLPFTGAAIFDILLAHIEKPHSPVTEHVKELPVAINEVFDKALAKNPTDRFQSAPEFKKSLILGPTDAIVGMVECLSCSREMKGNHKFCPHCGATNAHMVQAGKLDPVSAMETLERILLNEHSLLIPFFGRDRERNGIINFLRSRKLCLEISGESGVGKSALIRQALADLDSSAISVFFTESDPLGCQRSWWPVRRLASAMAGLTEHPAMDEILGVCMALELDPEDVPHLLHLFKLDADQPALEFNVRLREMITSVARFICAATQKKPTLFVLDDVDLYDLPSCRVLEQLYFMIQGLPVKFITTGENPLFAPEQMPGELYEHFRLAPLEADVAQDLCFVALSENGCSWQGHISALIESSNGLPLHLVEGMRLLSEGGSESSLPLADILQIRVRRLPKKAQLLLQWLSLIGSRISPELASLALENENDFTNAVDVCEKRGFLRWENRGEIVLSHARLTRLIPEEIPHTLRCEIHGRIHDLLKQSGTADPHVLAFHALYAQQLEDASHHFELAAGCCDNQLDDQGAVFYYKKAHELAQMEALSGRNELRYARISARLGDLLRFTGQLQKAEVILREALTFCTECENGKTCEAILLSSLARCVAGEPDQRAEDLITRATRVAQKSRDLQVLYRVYHDYGQIELQKGRYDLGITQLRMGLAMLEGNTRMPASTWRLYLQCAQCEFLRGKPENAIETCQSALEKPFITKSSLAQSRIHEQLAQIYIQLNRPLEAIIHLKKTIEHLRRTGDRISLVENTLHLMELDNTLRDEWAQNALDLSSRIGFFRGMEHAGALLGTGAPDLVN